MYITDWSILVIMRPLFSRMYSVISEAEVSLLAFCKFENIRQLFDIYVF